MIRKRYKGKVTVKIIRNKFRNINRNIKSINRSSKTLFSNEIKIFTNFKICEKNLIKAFTKYKVRDIYFYIHA